MEKYQEENQEEQENQEEKKRKADAQKKFIEKLPISNVISMDYEDDTHLYRIVKLGRDSAKFLNAQQWEHKILEEKQWRQLKIYQSRGWVHYSIFENEPYVMLFKKEKSIKNI